jgi:hypothetical protein
VADLRTGRPMRAGLHHRAGSAAKPLVATVVLQLVAERRLSLPDTVQRWLPGRDQPNGTLVDFTAQNPSHAWAAGALVRYGLRLVVIGTPAGPLVGHPGGIPGFLNIVLTTQDGRSRR